MCVRLLAVLLAGGVCSVPSWQPLTWASSPVSMVQQHCMNAMYAAQQDSKASERCAALCHPLSLSLSGIHVIFSKCTAAEEDIAAVP